MFKIFVIFPIANCPSILHSFPNDKFLINSVANSSILEDKRMAVQIFPKKITELWNAIEIRVLVLISLLLQVILVVFGSRRKYIASNWIGFLVWSVYLSADWVATVALGNLASSEGDSDYKSSDPDPKSLIQSFWAPFLLLHLGGPDTITAYALEDSELWLRHFLGLVVQVGVACYVFVKSWGANALTFLAIPVYVAGIVKYGERTWVLRSSSTKHIRNSLRSAARTPEVEAKLSIPRDPPVALDNYLHQAYYLFKISIYLLQDLILGVPELKDNRKIVSSDRSSEDVFKLIEVELGFLFDTLYTKALLVYSQIGIVFRAVSLLSSVAALLGFLVFVDAHRYPMADVAIAYVLLAGALVLEVYALVYLTFSDWTMVWLTKSGDPRTKSIRDAVYPLHARLIGGKRWSGSMAQYSLIGSCLKIKLAGEYLELLGIDELIKRMHVSLQDVDVDLKDLIFKHVRERAEKIVREDRYDIELRDEILAQRGGSVLESYENMGRFRWTTTQAEFNQSLIIWHVATDLCYYDDIADQIEALEFYPECTFSKRLSDYMMYLMVMSPHMLPFFHDVEYRYQKTCEEVQEFVDKKFRRNKKKKKASYGEKEISIGLLHEYEPAAPSDRHRFAKSALFHACSLGRQLKLMETSEKWKMVSEVWMEMLAYAANRCEGNAHAQQLRKGGELLTHVSLLMAHLGLSKQFEDKQAVRVKYRDEITGMDDVEQRSTANVTSLSTFDAPTIFLAK